ncbi:MAG: hypothetical protein JWN14_4332 [Chthonomonadales bacterium]|nr:hypothetical protein [Chthonomonadales bacterium]
MAGGMQGGYPPAPTRKQGNSGLLLWSLVGCGVIALLVVIIGGVMLSKTLKGSAGAKGMMNVLSSMEPAGQSMQKVEVALEDYQKDHNGKYPATLDALIPKYVSDKSAFVCGEGENAVPMEYTVPKSSDTDGFVVVRAHIGDLTLVRTQVQKMYVCLLKNGQVVSEQNVRTIMPKYSKDASGAQRTY